MNFKLILNHLGYWKLVLQLMSLKIYKRRIKRSPEYGNFLTWAVLLDSCINKSSNKSLRSTIPPQHTLKSLILTKFPIFSWSGSQCVVYFKWINTLTNYHTIESDHISSQMQLLFFLCNCFLTENWIFIFMYCFYSINQLQLKIKQQKITFSLKRYNRLWNLEDFYVDDMSKEKFRNFYRNLLFCVWTETFAKKMYQNKILNHFSSKNA